MITIRPATSDDLPRVAELALECFPEDFTPGDGAEPSLELARLWVTGRAALHPFGLTFVAEEGGQLHGYVFYLLLGGVSGVVELEAIGVASDQRGRGIGKALMAESEGPIAAHLREHFNVPLSKIP